MKDMLRILQTVYLITCVWERARLKFEKEID